MVRKEEESIEEKIAQWENTLTELITEHDEKYREIQSFGVDHHTARRGLKVLAAKSKAIKTLQNKIIREKYNNGWDVQDIIKERQWRQSIVGDVLKLT